ncbi:MAG: hypothetical protein KBS64_04020 [Treponema sp.]|nr:hypothetical protein [Candidatus Treponema equi]
MLEINVSSKSPAALTAALKKIKEMSSSGSFSKESAVHIILEPGVYRESVRYNLPNPVVIESTAGTKAEDCVIKADNCESYNKGLINRGVFVFGPNVTSVTMKNITLENTHVKTVMEGNTLADSAEALVWNNTTGTLACQGMRLIGRQNTLYVKGNSLFTECEISGDKDFIYGEAETAYFEDCTIYVREDNRGDMDGFVVSSQAIAEKSGFVFKNCRFTGDRKNKTTAYIIRTEGKGSATSTKDWDSLALVDCVIDDWYSPEIVWDDDMNLAIYPRGNAKNGIREYGTKTMDKNGKIEAADTARRSVMSYTLTDDDYFHGYASRYLVLHDTPLAGK